MRVDCPKCGGHNTYSTFVADGKTISKCFRASCGSTKMESNGYAKDTTPTRRRTLEDYTFVNVNANEQAYDLVTQYGIDIHRHGVRYDPTRDRVVFIQGEQAVGRSLSGANPKWYRYTDSNKPMVYGKGTKSLVIVEDCISAILVSKYCDSLALLGTSICEYYYDFFTKYDTLYIALDKDATNKSLDYCAQLNYVRPTKVIPLQQDLKALEYKELLELLNLWVV